MLKGLNHPSNVTEKVTLVNLFGAFSEWIFLPMKWRSGRFLTKMRKRFLFMEKQRKKLDGYVQNIVKRKPDMIVKAS